MNYSKIRRVLIIFLIALNAVLLLTLFDKYRETEIDYEEIVLNNLKTLENNGILISEDLYLKNLDEKPSFVLDSFLSESILTELVGDIVSAENNLYVGESGTATITQNGEFTISLNSTYTFSAVYELLKNSGFDVSNMTISYDGTIAKYEQKINGFDVFNANFEVILNSSDTIIKGLCFFDDGEISENTNEYNLLQVLLKIDSLQQINDEIIDIKYKYKLEGTSNPLAVPLIDIVFLDSNLLYDIYNDEIIEIY